MALMTTLSSGTTGLASASTDLSVISDNIANANTVGFKQGRADFEDALAQNIVGGNGQIGLGSQLTTVQKLMTQGSLTNTGNATDLALQGSGFFEVSGTAQDGRQGTFLTRDGQFTTDKDGYLVNLNGLRVQGYSAAPDGTLSTALGNLQVGNATSPPNATAQITIKANLQSDAPLVAAAWDPTQPAATSNYSTTVTLYDSLGKSYQAPVYFRRTGTGTWDWHAMTDGANVQGGTAGVPSQIAGGTLTFDTSGRLTGVTQNSNFNPVNAVAPQALTFNFGTPYAAGGGSGLDGITQFASDSATTAIGQDGYAAGQLTSIQVGKDGVVSGVFTNGQTRAIGQVSVATVAAPDQLERVGGNLYALTAASGQAVVGAPGDGGRGYISAGTLEQSTVDIADQFVKMIAAQRNFEANSKTITTADQLLSELIAMKR